MEGAEIVTGKRNKKRERHELAEEGSFRQQTTDFQQYVEIEQSNVDEPPKFDPVQESSVDPHKMPPSAWRLLPPSDGDPNPPPVRGGHAEWHSTLSTRGTVHHTCSDTIMMHAFVKQTSAIVEINLLHFV